MGVRLRRSYLRIAKQTAMMAGRYAHHAALARGHRISVRSSAFA
jgi:hypothetical protein